VLLVAAAGLQIVSATYSMFVQAFIGPTSLLRAYLIATAAFAAFAVPGFLYFGMIGAGMAQLVFVTTLVLSCRHFLQNGRALQEQNVEN
jgi:O-antigen/teichoic acid export membrane protein